MSATPTVNDTNNNYVYI